MAHEMSDEGENGVTTYYYTLSSLVTPKSNTFEFSLIIEAMNVDLSHFHQSHNFLLAFFFTFDDR